MSFSRATWPPARVYGHGVTHGVIIAPDDLDRIEAAVRIPLVAGRCRRDMAARLDAIARDLVDWSILNDQDVAARERAAYVAELASVLRRLCGLLGVFDVADAVDPVDVAALAAATAVTDIRDPADAAAVAAILREPLVDAREVGRAARRHRTRS